MDHCSKGLPDQASYLRPDFLLSAGVSFLDYIDGAELRDAESVLAQLGGWFEEYDTRAPHSALGMRSPAEYRADVTLSSNSTEAGTSPSKNTMQIRSVPL